MRDYSKVSPLFWTRGSGRRIRGNPLAQLVALYLMTCPGSNLIGVFYMPAETIAHETGLELAAVMAALDVLEREDVAHYDATSELVWLPAMARWQVGETMKPADKRRFAVLAELKKAKGHRFACDFVRRYQTAYCFDQPLDSFTEEAPSKALRSPSEGPSKGVTSDAEAPSKGPQATREEQYNTKQEQEQEQSERPPAPPLALEAPKARTGREAKGHSPCPPTDAPAEVVREWLERWRIPPEDRLVEKFLDWHRKHGKAWKDWTAAWRDWKRREFSPPGGRPQVVQSAENRAWKMPEGFE